MQTRLSSRVDTYKQGHFLQRRPGTQYVSSYIEARGVEPGRNWKEVMMAGTTYHLNEYLSKPLVTAKDIPRMERRMKTHGVSYNVEGWKHILNKHGGYAPVHIQALPEGLVVPLRTPMLQIVNTDPQVEWIGSWLETTQLRGIWYPSTVATLSFHIKRIIKYYMKKTAGHTDGLDFQLHDFGPRGVSSGESAQIGGAAHLFNFQGTDNNEALEMLAEYYDEDMAGFNIDAAEHSTVTSFGGPEYETEAYEHLIKTFGQDNKLFSIVSDSYDLYNAIDNIYGGPLKSQIQDLGNRNSRLVVRPDSGDPVIVVCEVIQRLMAKFGYTTNAKGYKVLPPYIRVIQGDGVNETSIKQILAQMAMLGLSAENVVFGMGGALLQGVNRDTLQFAMKASGAKNPNFKDGEWYDIVKSPKTDMGKASKGGRHMVLMGDNGIPFTTREDDYMKYSGGSTTANLLETVYLNGEIKKLETLRDIRARANAAL